MLALALLVAACGGERTGEEVTTGVATEPATVTSEEASTSFSEADLDAYARGLRREIDAVREAQRQASSAKTAAERGRAMQAGWETSTIPLGAEAAGLPVDRYRSMRESLDQIFRTLDHQGTIDGPTSVDIDRVDAATKERLSRDPFADLPAGSAAALRAKLNTLVPVWAEYVQASAVAG